MWPLSVLFPCNRCSSHFRNWQTDLCYRANSACWSRMFMFLEKFPSHPLNVKSSSALPATDISSAFVSKTETGALLKPNISTICYSVYCFLWIAQVTKCRMRNVTAAFPNLWSANFGGWSVEVSVESICFLCSWLASCLLFSTDIFFKQYLIVVGDLIAYYRITK